MIDGGYIQNGQYHFYLTDHLGNNRMVVKQDTRVVQKNHYYPFGMSFADNTNAQAQPYKYNGKEQEGLHKLNMYDYSARHYTPDLPRFTTMDPLAEKYPHISPYAYVENNPLKYIDPTGKEKLNGVGKRGNGDAKVDSRMDIDNDMIHIYAHGGVRGFTFIDVNNNVTTVKNANDLKYLLNRYSSIWNNRLPGEELVIVLHSCEAGKIYEGMGVTLVEKLSAEMPDVIMVAVNEDIYWNIDDEFAADEQGNVGDWVYYKDGMPIFSQKAVLQNNPDRKNYKRPSYSKGNTKEEQQAQSDKGSDKSKNKPKEYEGWGTTRKWFYDEFGF